MQLVLLSGDLMLMSSAHGAAARHGVQLRSAPNSDAALAACDDDQARVLAIDLRTPGLDIGSLVAEVRARRTAPLHIMASGPHVHEQSLAAAATAGCDEVITRGEFDRRLDAALARLVRPSS